MIRTAAALALGLAAAPVLGFEPELPEQARRLSGSARPLDSYSLPIGPYADGRVPVRRLEGAVERATWRIGASELTTLQVLRPLREQLERRGFALIFECRDTDCGGFDFRFGIEVLPPPQMYVDIRDYRFLAATGGNGEAISLLISRSREAAYVQIVHVNRDTRRVFAPADAAGPRPTPRERPVNVAPRGLAAQLEGTGHAVLPDLSFGTGSSALQPGDYAALTDLAAYLRDHPGLVIAVVGHTDSVGSLERNIALSKRRAQSVRQRLIDAHGIAPARIEAEGMGYLSPVASNLTPEGREANRRVEAVILRDR